MKLRLTAFLFMMRLSIVAAFSVMGLGMSPAQDWIMPSEPPVGAVTGTNPSSPAVRQGRAQQSRAVRETQRPGQYYIDFRARHALTYGHSFVMFGRLDGRGRQLTREVAGLHPASDNPQVYMMGHLIWVPSDTGPSDGDLEDEYLAASYRVYLTKDQYDRVVAFIRDLQRNSPMWHAALYNCSSFVARIANFMGFNAPGHLEYPENFINGMKSLNGGRNTMVEQVATYAAPQVESSR
jgi:hypothetical protein